MGNLGVVFWLIVLVMSILNIILFFKIWIMTDDVNDIKRIMQGETVIQEVDVVSNNDGTVSQEVDVVSNNDGTTKKELRFQEHNKEEGDWTIVIIVGIFIFVMMMIVVF